MLYTIETDGTVMGVNVDTLPSYEHRRTFLNCTVMEHVAVLFQGREAHMFIDEDGLSKELPLNHRASRVYANVVLARHGQATYDDLTVAPSRGVVLTVERPLVIVGRAILWCGKLPR